ncbi:peptide-methionine (R)-S-oxide reductase MsrB [Bartonella sp. HY038]|uniref:peptide-methionine (R)-S-oxide reductase MsrB n=1 Tax=Bartonella sp. HY038 TaxID=2759660 RepID=UPI0015F7C1D9|nr:peptide-methionine (R)-S-oxide reductase MsrB [Bartonella sp. HY038]
MNRLNNTHLKVIKTDEEWQEQLTPIQYQITRQHGTERAFSSPDFDTSHPGIFRCICCGNALYDSSDKYESGTGWPSFSQPIREDAVICVDDHSYGMERTEIRCADCDAHLGHVFPDGPPPTGLRFCMNGHALSYDQQSINSY